MLSNGELRETMLLFDQTKLSDDKKANRKKVQAYILKEYMQKALFSTDVVIYDVETSDNKVFVLCVVNTEGEKKAVDDYEVPGGIDVPIVTLFKGDPKIEELLNAQAQKDD